MTSFKPMLAETADLSKLVFPLIAQPKWDGFRIPIPRDLGPVTRTLGEIPNRFLRDALSKPCYRDHDGELVTYTDGKPDELNTVQSKVTTADGEFEFRYHAFDHLADPTDSYLKRWARISAGDRVGYESMADLDALLDYEDELSRGGLTAKGLDGVIVRDPTAPYKFGRSTVKEGWLLRIKPFHDDEAEVIGITEKMTNGNEQCRDARGYSKRSSAKAGMIPAGTCGSLEMRWANGVGFNLNIQHPKLRDAIWSAPETYLGRKVTFKYQRVGPKGAPLLPIFKAFRNKIDIISRIAAEDFI